MRRWGEHWGYVPAPKRLWLTDVNRSHPGLIFTNQPAEELIDKSENGVKNDDRFSNMQNEMS